jgi:hypothetical protein
MNAARLGQARGGIRAVIAESREAVTVSRARMVDDGYGTGGLVPDPTGARDMFPIVGRISHESGGPGRISPGPAGFSDNLQRYLLVDYRTVIVEGDLFDAQGRSWRIGRVDRMEKFGGVVGFQAHLYEAGDAEVST